MGNTENYNTFFQYLTSICETEDTSVLTLKKILCPHIMEKWNNLTKNIMDRDDGITYVNMQHYELLQKKEIQYKGSDQSQIIC